MFNRSVNLVAGCAVLVLLAGCDGGAGGAAPRGSAPPPETSPAPPDDDPAVDDGDDAAALARIRTAGAAIGLGPEDAVRQREVLRDDLGEDHVRFERFHAGLHVRGGDFVVHSRADRDRDGFSATLREPVALDLAPVLTADDAVQIGVARFTAGILTTPTAELVIDAYDRPVLAYDVLTEGEYEDEMPSILHVIVDATTGAVVREYDDVQTHRTPWWPWHRHPPPPPPPPPPAPVTRTASIGTGKSLYAGQVQLNTARVSTGVFELRDLSGRNTGAVTLDAYGSMGGGILLMDADDIWGNFLDFDRASAGVDAHFGALATYDYFMRVLGRRGYADDGSGPTAQVHFGRRMANAFWIPQCSCIVFGDGNGGLFGSFAGLDIVAHELTHGLTSRSANLVYSGESGGLNEATSDIFGACVEFYTNNASQPGNWLIGEKIYKVAGLSLRNMADPTLDRVSIDHYSRFVANMDVHYSSGIANNFFFLLAEGGKNRTSGMTVGGIGRGKAERIWYRALTVYMTSGTKFAGARTATLGAAGDLFGAASAERTAVAAAWTAVGVR